MAYALNRAMPADEMAHFVAVAQATEQALARTTTVAPPAEPRKVLSDYVRTKQLQPDAVPALAAVSGRIGTQVRESGSLASVPRALLALQPDVLNRTVVRPAGGLPSVDELPPSADG